MSLAFLVCKGQFSDSIVIRKNSTDTNFVRFKQYSSVTFRFFYFRTGEPIKSVTLDIDNIRLGMDIECGNNLIRAYLLEKSYSVAVRFSLFEHSRIYNLPIEMKYDYDIDIYLSIAKKNAHQL